MLKNVKRLLCLLLSALILFSVFGCGKRRESGKEDSEPVSEEDYVSEASDVYSGFIADFSLTNKKNGAPVEILPADLRTFLDYTTTREQAGFLEDHYLNHNSTYYDVSNVTLTWEETAAEEYTVYIADNALFKDAVLLTVSTNSCDVGFLIPGKTYFYKVVDSDFKRSDVDYFKVSDKYSLRNISAGYAFNMRDLGGWKTEDGKKVKYGMVYRNGYFDYLKNDDEKAELTKYILLNVLGIKTEIDLRQSESGTLISYLGFDDNHFINCPITYYSQIIPGFVAPYPCDLIVYTGDENLTSIKRFFETLSDADNYPVTYHCLLGADRTGTLSFLLNGFLGVAYDDLVCDYELTSFSNKCNRRWRSNIVDGDFDDTGIMGGTWDTWCAFGLLYQTIMEKYGDGDKKLSSAISEYLTTECGISLETLNKVKSIMLV